MLNFPFAKVKQNIDKINIEKLRTSEKRILFIKKLKPYIKFSESWEEAIEKLLDNGFLKSGV